MSFIKELTTDNPDILLVEPLVQRDAEISLIWLKGEAGRESLQSMGVAPKDIKSPALKEEAARIQGFINDKDQLNWMISYKGNIVGAVWVDLVENNNLQAPSLHIMIGDVKARGRGIGFTVIKTVVNYLLHTKNYKTVYSRHLKDNYAIKNIFKNLVFKNDGEPYKDKDGLTWQNVKIIRN